MVCNIRLSYCFAFLVCLLALSGSFAQGQAVNVLTRNYNNQRTGANLAETALNVSNVGSNQFGKLFMLPVDDQVYAGVLYVSGLQIGGGTHNVIYVATMNNSVYAFDADTLSPPLWFKNFNGTGQPSTNAEVGGGGGYHDFIGNIGIVGTPVIDGSAGTIFFVTRTVENGATVQRLHAVDITSGVDRPNSPQVIQGTASGIGFVPDLENQRPALALSQGVVYIAWASYGDSGSYYGWVLAYNSTTLSPAGIFNAAPGGGQAGIWMAGAGPAFDGAGNAYFPTGNGTFDGTTDFGESIVKLSPGSMNVLDYFAPSDYATLNAQDLDFGSAGPTLLPGSSLMVQGGKEGKLYLLNTNSLGHEAAGDVQIPQVFQAVDLTLRPSATHHIHNASPVWNAPSGLNVYVWGENDFIHAYQLNPSTQTLNTTPLVTGSILPPQGMPGGMMTISASGSQSGTGIVWATVPRNGDANQATVPGNLYAFNAENLNLLWSSTGTGDDLLNFSKGSAPIVANGKLYVGSLSRFVTVYGLKADGQNSQDLALNQPASGSAPCTAGETPSQAVNGSFSGGLNDKWCSSAPNPYLLVDLGSPQSISRFVVEHAGAGGESFSLNSSAYNIQVSTDGVNFTTVVSVTGNIDSITTNDIAPTTARYVELNIVTPTQSGSPPASIYEFQVFGAQSAPSPDFSLQMASNSQTVTAGSTASYTATVEALNGFSGTVTLSASGLPAGTTASFNPDQVNGAGTSAVSLVTTPSTAGGSYTVTITGVSGTLQQSGTVTLVVNPSSTPASISSSAGTPQSATINTAFATPLQAIVKNAQGDPVSGVTVTFTAPSSGAGASFSGSATSTAITSSSGVATAPTLAANAIAGSYTVTASVAGVALPASFSLTNYPVNTTNGYSYTRAITIEHTEVPNSDRRNFPMLFASTDALLKSGANGGHVTSASGYDIIFTADAAGTQKLNHEIESYNAATGQFIAWVQVPGVSHTADTVIYLFYGNSGITTSQENKTAVWDSNYQAVYHLGNGAAISLADSTSNGNTLTNHEASPASGEIAGGASFNGSSAYMLCGMTNYPTGNSAYTVSGWMSPRQNSHRSKLLSFGNSATAQGTFFGIDPSNDITIDHFSDDYTSSSTTVAMGAWSYLTDTFDGTTDTVYVNGAFAFRHVPVGPLDVTLDACTIGSYIDQWNDLMLGSLDEIRVSNSARSSDWIATEYNNQSSPSTFYALGSESSTGSVVTIAASAGTPQSATVGTPFAAALQATVKGNGGSALSGVTVTFTAPGNGAGAAFSGSTTSTATTNSSGVAIAPTLTANGTSGNYIVTATVAGATAPASFSLTNVPATPADFSFSTSPGSETVTAGGTGSYTATVGALNGFSGTVTLTASGLPAGITASFNPNTVSTAGSSMVSLVTTGSTAPGSYTVTISGVSGALQHSSTVTLVVNAAVTTGGAGGVSVNLSSGWNRSGIVTDGSAFAGGLDGLGNAYSAKLLGSTVKFQGSTFTLGPANAPDAVSSITIPLPVGQYTTLAMLAAGVDGNQPSQTFVVNYSDGTSSDFAQSISDWYTPQSYAGESVAVTMAYRDTAAGTEDNRTFYLYGYSFPLNSAKTASSITLPNNGDVAVLAITLAPMTLPADFSLSASPGSQTVTAGGASNYTATVGALNGFSGTVTLGASGLPAGTTASFNPNALSAAGSSVVSLVTTGSTAPGAYTVTITGGSGTLQHTSAVTLVVNAASAGGEAVNLAAVYNRSSGMVTDGSTFSGGLDGLGNAFSANLLGSTVSFQGLTFTLGPANAPDAVSSITIPLPVGQYTTLATLAAAVDGNQPSQTFVVNYSDGTSSDFAQSVSDWYTPQSYAGESVAVTMAYRDSAAGTEDKRTFYLYGYSFPLNSAKTASSIILPNNGDVMVLAITLVP